MEEGNRAMAEPGVVDAYTEDIRSSRDRKHVAR